LERIKRMEKLAETMTPEERKACFQKIERLKHWLVRGQKMMPWILRFLVH
jgi:hypothetical protein